MIVTFGAEKIRLASYPTSRSFRTNEITFPNALKASDRAADCYVANPVRSPTALSVSLCAPQYGISEVRAGCVGARQIRIGQICTR